MSDWKGRLRPEITLTAPDSTQFTAAWQGNDISGTKDVGKFRIPLRDGAKTQDMGADGLEFPLTLTFEGADHDLTAMRFVRTFLRQRGLWKVVHPIYGTLSLQGVGVTLAANPTGSGNQSKVETSWIEPGEVDTETSAAELGARVQAQADVVAAAAAAQFTDGIDLSDAEASASVAIAATAGLGAFDASQLAKLSARVTEIHSAVGDAYAQVSAAFAAIPMELINGAAQVQTLLQLPALINADITAKVTAYTDFCTRLIEGIGEGSDPAAINRARTCELFLTSALTGIAAGVAISEPATREQAVQAISDLQAMFDDVTTALDTVQDATAENLALAQYFSHGATYADLARLISMAIAYLMRLTFDLKIAKRFALSVPRAPIEITIAEYGSLGERDINLDFFIATNHLQGNDIILLPAGREVVVYV
ncbi:MAG: DNA circularization N-terminal domain-containing protein [Spirochaetes bacterium]|nr:DNA circularization N-terminal domain-containing protein [Spirochaetota bacterium]